MTHAFQLAMFFLVVQNKKPILLTLHVMPLDLWTYQDETEYKKRKMFVLLAWFGGTW